MQADILVLHHHAPGLEVAGHIEILVRMQRGCFQALTEIAFLAVVREGDAIHRTDVDAGIALDAERGREHGLDVAVQAAMSFAQRQLDVIAELDLGADVLQRDHLVAMRHLVALVVGDVVVIAPFVDAHLLRGDVHVGQWPLGDVLAREHFVDRQRGVMALRHRPDDVFGPNAASPPKNTFGLVETKVCGSTLGMCHLSNSMPQSCSIQGRRSPGRPRPARRRIR